MLDVRYSHLYFYQSLNRLQRGLSAIAELLVVYMYGLYMRFDCLGIETRHYAIRSVHIKSLHIIIIIIVIILVFDCSMHRPATSLRQS